KDLRPVVSSFTRVDRECSMGSCSGVHKSQIKVVEVVQVGEYRIEVGAGQAEPARQGCGVLINAGGGYQATLADIVVAVQVQIGHGAVNIPTFYRAAHNQLVSAPGVVGAIAVAGESTAEIGRGKRCDLL